MSAGERAPEKEGYREMSLVDYASSSDEDEEAEPIQEQQLHSQVPLAPNPDPPLPQTQSSASASDQQPEIASSSSVPSIEKLPDASFLLNSPAISSHLLSGYDHSSRVAAAMAESASRKREAKGFSSSLPRSKVPKGTLPHSRNVPDTVGGLLVPPQLKGKSNVVTEDLSKLFVKKPVGSSSQ